VEAELLVAFFSPASQIKPRMLHFISFLSLYPLMIVTFHAILYEPWKIALNNATGKIRIMFH
jgi:hypothetical protein